MRAGVLTRLVRVVGSVALCLMGPGQFGVQPTASGPSGAAVQAAESAGPRIQWVRAVQAEVVDVPDGRAVAVLSRATPVEALGASGRWRLVNVDGWIDNRQVPGPDSLSGPYECRLTGDTRLFDAPMAWYWGGDLESLGAEVGTLSSGALVRCLGSERETMHVSFQGWVLGESLTSVAEDVGVPESCASLTVIASGDSTRIQGIMKWPHATDIARKFRLVLYGRSGERVFVAPLYLAVEDGDVTARDGVAFEIGVPVRRDAISTCRVATPGAGIIALFN